MSNEKTSDLVRKTLELQRNVHRMSLELNQATQDLMELQKKLASACPTQKLIYNGAAFVILDIKERTASSTYDFHDDMVLELLPAFKNVE